MHARTTAQGAKGQTFYQYWNKAHVTIHLNGKTTSCDGMQPTRLKRTTSHLAPHLGGVAANIGTLNRAGAYTLARACASALQTCLSTNMLTQQAFEPLVNHDFFQTSGSTMLWPGTLVEVCRVKIVLNNFYLASLVLNKACWVKLSVWFHV
jgi:hypothetical protein